MIWPLHFAFALTVRFVNTIGIGSGSTTGASNVNPPSSASLLSTETACTLVTGASDADPVTATNAISTVMQATERIPALRRP